VLCLSGLVTATYLTAADKSGRPAFAVSTMSFHTSDLAADGRCSLTVASPSFKSMTDGRVTLVVGGVGGELT
jgi:putative heme iron utilization protein